MKRCQFVVSFPVWKTNLFFQNRKWFQFEKFYNLPLWRYLWPIKQTEILSRLLVANKNKERSKFNEISMTIFVKVDKRWQTFSAQMTEKYNLSDKVIYHSFKLNKQIFKIWTQTEKGWKRKGANECEGIVIVITDWTKIDHPSQNGIEKNFKVINVIFIKRK